MRAGVLWRAAALCFAAGWACCAAVDLWIAEHAAVLEAQLVAQAAAAEDRHEG